MCDAKVPDRAHEILALLEASGARDHEAVACILRAAIANGDSAAIASAIYEGEYAIGSRCRICDVEVDVGEEYCSRYCYEHDYGGDY